MRGTPFGLGIETQARLEAMGLKSAMCDIRVDFVLLEAIALAVCESSLMLSTAGHYKNYFPDKIIKLCTDQLDLIGSAKRH